MSRREKGGQRRSEICWVRLGCLFACIAPVGRKPVVMQAATAYPSTAGSPHSDRLASTTPIAVAASTSLG